ncbi:MAG: PBP1b-binding outer membrane lipoprotein LpoB [Psychroserpens sp.]|jgi:PBP1b-binding outer membrane lipoprotein LpoB
MKKLLFILLFAITLLGCSNSSENIESEPVEDTNPSDFDSNSNTVLLRQVMYSADS